MATPQITNKEQKSKIWIWVGVIGFGIFIFALWQIGLGNILKFFEYVAIIIFLLGLIAGAVYIILLILRPTKVDIVWLTKKKLIEAGIRNKPDRLGNLVLSGDSGHTRVVWGKIIGYCRVQILTEKNEYDQHGFMKYIKDPHDTKRLIPKSEIVKEEQDVFITEKKGMFSSWFSEPDVVRLHPSQHSDLLGDVVCKGFSFLPISEFWYLNTEFLDVAVIDRAILTEAKRGVFFLGLADMKSIVDKAIDLDSSHRKIMDQKNLLDMPIPGQDPSQNKPAI